MDLNERKISPTFQQFIENYVGDVSLHKYQEEMLLSFMKNKINMRPPMEMGELIIPAYSFTSCIIHHGEIEIDGTFAWNEYGCYVSKNLLNQGEVIYDTDVHGLVSNLSIK